MTSAVKCKEQLLLSKDRIRIEVRTIIKKGREAMQRALGKESHWKISFLSSSFRQVGVKNFKSL